MILNFIIIGFGMVAGDMFMKSWASHNYLLHGVSLMFYISALVMYAASLTFYGKQLQFTNFSIATTLPIIINIIVVTLITIFYYKEQLSLNAIIGTALAVISVLFICLS